MTRSESYRRAQERRAKARVLRHYYSRWLFGLGGMPAPEWLDEAFVRRWAGIHARTRTPCSCFMCQNKLRPDKESPAARRRAYLVELETAWGWEE